MAHGPDKRDWTGVRIGMLTGVEFVEIRNKANTAYWRFRCDCGELLVRAPKGVLAAALASCRACRYADETGPNSRSWKGFGDIPANHFNHIKAAATSRGLDLNLTIEDLWALFLNQERRCALTGWPLQFGTAKTSRPLSKETTASLDRIDNNLGYVPGNVQWLHKDVNWMKGKFEQGYFLTLCSAVRSFDEVRANAALPVPAPTT